MPETVPFVIVACRGADRHPLHKAAPPFRSRTGGGKIQIKIDIPTPKAELKCPDGRHLNQSVYGFSLPRGIPRFPSVTKNRSVNSIPFSPGKVNSRSKKSSRKCLSRRPAETRMRRRSLFRNIRYPVPETPARPSCTQSEHHIRLSVLPACSRKKISSSPAQTAPAAYHIFVLQARIRLPQKAACKSTAASDAARSFPFLPADAPWVYPVFFFSVKAKSSLFSCPGSVSFHSAGFHRVPKGFRFPYVLCPFSPQSAKETAGRRESPSAEAAKPLRSP